MRAVQYSEAVIAACGFGWWIYPPVDALLLWDGRAVSRSFDGETWEPIPYRTHVSANAWLNMRRRKSGCSRRRYSSARRKAAGIYR